MPCYHSARESQIYYNIDSFYALQRKITYKFVERCHLSQNLWLKMLMSSDCFYDSLYYDHYCGILFVNEYDVCCTIQEKNSSCYTVFLYFCVCIVLVYGLYESEINTD